MDENKKIHRARKRARRRKKTFAKAKRQSRTYENVTGMSAEKEIGCRGRFKKDTHLNIIKDNNGYGTDKDKDNRRTRQEKYDTEEQINDYSKYSKPDTHESLYFWE